MKEKLKLLLFGIIFVAAAFLAPVWFDGFTLLLLGFIPLNATVLTWLFGIVGGLCLLGFVLSLFPDKKKKD